MTCVIIRLILEEPVPNKFWGGRWENNDISDQFLHFNSLHSRDPLLCLPHSRCITTFCFLTSARLGHRQEGFSLVAHYCHHCLVQHWLGFQNLIVLCGFQQHEGPPIQNGLCEVSGSSPVAMKPLATCVQRITAVGNHWPGETQILASQSGESCRASLGTAEGMSSSFQGLMRRFSPPRPHFLQRVMTNKLCGSRN